MIISPIRDAGDRLIAAAKREFPTSGRCTKCGFRALYHYPAEHKFQAPEHPFVKALQEFVEAIDERNPEE